MILSITALSIMVLIITTFNITILSIAILITMILIITAPSIMTQRIAKIWHHIQNTTVSIMMLNAGCFYAEFYYATTLLKIKKLDYRKKSSV